jgi:adenylate kinase
MMVLDVTIRTYTQLWKIRKKLKNNILKMKNIIIFGAPGSGKGTYSDEIVAKYGMGHISTGDVLRGEIKNGTELGTIAKGYIDNGQLIPDELMIDILAKTYDSLEAGKGVIFDGFPRTIAQAEALKKMLAERNHDMGMMVELVVDEETLMARLLNRAIEQGRADDNEETIKKRFEVYHNQTAPLAEWFEKEGLRNTFTWKGSKEQMLSDIFEAIDAENK